MNEEEYLEKHSKFNECGDESLRNFMIAIDLMENEKYCTRCKNVKKIQEFGNKQHWCKECKSTSFKEYYNNNKEKFKENLKNDYKNRKREILCTCGRVIYSVSYKTHLKTKIHSNLLIKAI